MNVNIDITPKEWAHLVNVSSRTHNKIRGEAGQHKYIVVKNNQYQLVKATDMNQPGELRKLSLSDIATISSKKLSELQTLYSASPSKAMNQKKIDEFEDLATEMTSYTALILSTAKKRNQRTKQIARGIAWIFSAIFGLPFAFAPIIALRDYNSQFNQKQAQLKSDLVNLQRQANVHIESMQEQRAKQREVVQIWGPDLLKDLKVDSDLAEQLLLEENIPDVLIELINTTDQLKKSKDDSTLKADHSKKLNLVTSYIAALKNIKEEFGFDTENAIKLLAFKYSLVNDSVPELNHAENQNKIKAALASPKEWEELQTQLKKSGQEWGLSEQLVKDIPRGTCFVRTDDYLSIRDTASIPSSANKDSSTRIEEAAKGLQGIARSKVTDKEGYKKDLPWIIALQSYISQTSANGLGSIVKELRKIAEIPDCNFELVDKSLEAAPEDAIPKAVLPADVISLEVIRDSNHDIETINISVHREYNVIKIVHNQDTQQAENRVLIADALKGKLDFSVTLGERGVPLISDFRCEFSTAVLLPS